MCTEPLNQLKRPFTAPSSNSGLVFVFMGQAWNVGKIALPDPHDFLLLAASFTFQYFIPIGQGT